MKGSLELIGGPMYSSKSSTLLGQLTRDLAINRHVLYINHSFDTRSIEPFSTHHPLFKPNVNLERLTMMKCPTLPTMEEVSMYDTIGIDESQFFENLMIVVDYVEKLNKRIVVCGLVGDSNRHNFGQFLNLLPYAEHFTQLQALCSVCGKDKLAVPAPFTHRIINDNHQINVGGNDKYMAVCRQHYIQLNL